MYTYFVTLSRKDRIDVSDPRTEKVIICCSTLDRAILAQAWAYTKDEYRSINLVKRKPYYSSKRYKPTYIDYETLKNTIEG